MWGWFCWKNPGDRRRLGHISKPGHSLLRYPLVEAVPSRRGRKIAKVAVARIASGKCGRSAASSNAAFSIGCSDGSLATDSGTGRAPGACQMTDYVSVCQAMTGWRPPMVALLGFASRNGDPFPLELGLLFRSWRGISKGRSNWTATAKSPLDFGCTRTTLPRAVKRAPMWLSCATPTSTPTVEPSGIMKALDKRMPPRLTFSDWVRISLSASLSKTGRCRG